MAVAQLVIRTRADDVIADHEVLVLHARLRCGSRRSRRGGRRSGLRSNGSRRRARDRCEKVTDDDDPFRLDPLHVGAHAFGDDAQRHDERALVDLGRHVERSRLAVDHDFRLADRHFDVGARFAHVDGFRRVVEGDVRAHLLEDRTQRHEDRGTAHERRKDAAFAQPIGLGVNMAIVEKERNFAVGRAAEIRRYRGLRDDLGLRGGRRRRSEREA